MTRLAAAGAFVCAAAVTAAGAAHPQLISRQVHLMGTTATLSTYDGERGRGLDRLERLLTALETTEAQLSTWRPASEVSRLNAAAGRGPQQMSPSLCAALELGAAWVAHTNGAFDPAVGALMAAWDIHGEGRVAAPNDVHEALRRSGWQRLRFDSARCSIELPEGVSIDVGAWGKGEGLDRARAALGAAAAPWLIDLGGQVAAHGSPPDGGGWPVAIAHPLRRSEPLLEVRMTSGSLSTSAGSERDLHVDGRRIGHILDPRTGYPARFTGSVSVWHEQALVADMLSTALFVMGPDGGLRWADARGIAACYLVPDGTRIVRQATPAFTKRFTS